MAILKIRDADGNVQEILALKGDKGEKGDKGDRGADGTMTFEDLTEEQKESLKGDKGEKGADGTDYVLTEADKQEIATMAVEKLSSETWTFTLEDGSTVTKTVVLK